jgi:hypothetical protein
MGEIFGTTAFGEDGGGDPPDLSAFRWLEESISVADTPGFEVSIMLMESLGMSEETATAVAPGIMERLQLAESLSNGAAYVSEIINGVYMHDEPLLAWMLLIAEGITLADVTAETATKLALCADVLVATGAVENRMDAQAAIAIALALEDLAASGWSAEASDAAEFAEAWATTLKMAETMVESALLADTATGSLRIMVLASDTGAAADSTSAIGALNAIAEDGATIFASIRLDGGEYSAWVLNTETSAPSEYRNFKFNSMVEFNGKYYGATDDGIYELDIGDDDEGAAIPAWIRTGLSNLGNGKMKRLPAMYLGYTSSGVLVLKVVSTNKQGAKVEDWYLPEVKQAQGMSEGRFKPGKGLKSVYWAFELHNKAGADFELDNVTLFPLILDRRVQC